jgi:hypothetical protein
MKTIKRMKLNDVVFESKEYALVWLGRSTQMPDTGFYSTLTVGKIRFDNGEISGHFEAMMGIGLPHGRCEFRGRRQTGPCVVPFSIQDAVNEWNSHGLFCEDEAPRSPSGTSDEPKDENPKSRASAIVDSPSTMSQELNGERRKEYLGFVTGIFGFSSEEIEREWPKWSQGLTIRFHIDEQQEKIWGHFDVGIVEGYILLNIPPDRLVLTVQ